MIFTAPGIWGSSWRSSGSMKIWINKWAVHFKVLLILLPKSAKMDCDNSASGYAGISWYIRYCISYDNKSITFVRRKSCPLKTNRIFFLQKSCTVVSLRGLMQSPLENGKKIKKKEKKDNERIFKIKRLWINIALALQSKLIGVGRIIRNLDMQKKTGKLIYKNPISPIVKI